MEYQSNNPFPEECVNGINFVAAYQMFISDMYLTLACYFTGPTGMPTFAMFFETVAEVKFKHAKDFLRFLRRREGMVRIPSLERANIGQPETPVEGLTYAMDMEDKLTEIIADLKTTASQAGETQLVQFVEEFLVKQQKCRKLLECHILKQREEEHKRKRKLSDSPPEPSGSGGDLKSGAA